MKLPKNHAFKVLDTGRKANSGGNGVWPKPGTWMEVKGDLTPCENGLHLCRKKDLIEWLGPVIWLAEYDSAEIVDGGNKFVVRRARLVKRFKTWNAKTARLFACDCAERVLPIYEKKHFDDKRPRKAILAARKYANGKINKRELAAARAAAGDAARDAAWDAAWAAAWAATRDAAGDAAWAVARAAAGDAARDVERAWQTKRLMQILEG